MKKTIICAALVAASFTTAFAQSGTNSPYSQYGLGLHTDLGSSFNHGMNGLGLGFHEHNQVNYLNPASYSNIDSLTFIFDAGLSGQITSFQEGNVKKNANNANFEYVVAGFRMAPRLGMSFGIVPYTNVGYNYSTSEVKERDYNGQPSNYVTNTYAGSGGIHQVYVGLGWMPFKNFSLGVNGGYLWGTLDRSITNSYTNTSVNSLLRNYSASISSYKVDFGLQYTLSLSKKDALTLGLTYGLGHKICDTPSVEDISVNSQTSVTDTTTYYASNGMRIPTSYGVGLMYNHNNKLKIGFDYSLQKYGTIEIPTYYNEKKDEFLNSVSEEKKNEPVIGYFKDRSKYTLGFEYVNNEQSRNWGDRIRYRFGVSYATPYYYINGQDGPKEYSVSAGFGIPLVNYWNNRSILNISFQYARQEAKNLIKENTFRINIGLTFNESWFAKWKVK